VKNQYATLQLKGSVAKVQSNVMRRSTAAPSSIFLKSKPVAMPISYVFENARTTSLPYLLNWGSSAEVTLM
jgi:hypothetical protein